MLSILEVNDCNGCVLLFYSVWFPDYLHSIAKPVNPCGKCIKESLQETSLWINDTEINMDSTKLCSSICAQKPPLETSMNQLSRAATSLAKMSPA